VNKFYEWNSDSQVVIYGAAALGTLVYRHIKKTCRVIAFFDKRGDELETCMGLPVYTPDRAPFNESERKRLIVFLAIKNIFEHEQLVNYLVGFGYERIIFKAADQSVFDKRGLNGLGDIGNVFEQVVQGRLALPSQIPLFNERFRVEWRDHAIIEKSDGRLVAHVPVQDIATNQYGDVSYAWENVPIAAMFPHLEFFEYLAGDSSSNPDFYVEDFIAYTARRNGDYATTERWKQNVIQNRTMVHEQMNLAWELDRAFFVRNAPEAVWNAQGHFNLISGKHRATFLVSKGSKFIALSMSTEDYTQYLNQPALARLMSAVDASRTRSLPMPVLHPFFYRHPSTSTEAFYGLLARLVRILGKQLFLRYGVPNFGRLYVVDASRSWAALSLRLAKLGVQVTRTHGLSEWELQLAALYRIDPSRIGTASDCDRLADLMIFDEVEMTQGIADSRLCLFILNESELGRIPHRAQRVLMSFFQDGRKQVVVLTENVS